MQRLQANYWSFIPHLFLKAQIRKAPLVSSALAKWRWIKEHAIFPQYCPYVNYLKVFYLFASSWFHISPSSKDQILRSHWLKNVSIKAAACTFLCSPIRSRRGLAGHIPFLTGGGVICYNSLQVINAICTQSTSVTPSCPIMSDEEILRAQLL